MVQTRNAVKRATAAVVDAVLGSNDVLLGVVPYLEGVEVVNLALVSRHFGSKIDGDCSLVEEVARQITEEERAALPRYDGESWIALLSEWQKLRSPLEFDQLVGYPLEYVDGDKSCITSYNDDMESMDLMGDNWTGHDVTALCSSNIMRAGKHYAIFTLTGCVRCFYAFVGVMRPVEGLDQWGYREFCVYLNELSGWANDIERGGRWGSNINDAVDCCSYDTYSGHCWSYAFESARKERSDTWNGMKGFELDDGEVGLLLDLDEGTLAVYKNGRKLGIMKEGSSLG